jgi:hypothetical protein
MDGVTGIKICIGEVFQNGESSVGCIDGFVVCILLFNIFIIGYVCRVDCCAINDVGGLCFFVFLMVCDFIKD